MKVKIEIQDQFGVSHVTECTVDGSLSKTLNVVRSALWSSGFNYIDNISAVWNNQDGVEINVSADDELIEDYNNSYSVPEQNKTKPDKNKLSTFMGDDGHEWAFDKSAHHMYHAGNRMAVVFLNKIDLSIYDWDKDHSKWTVQYYKDRELEFIKNWDCDEDLVEMDAEDYVNQTGNYGNVFQDENKDSHQNVLPLFDTNDLGWFNNKQQKHEDSKDDQ